MFGDPDLIQKANFNEYLDHAQTYGLKYDKEAAIVSSIARYDFSLTDPVFLDSRLAIIAPVFGNTPASRAFQALINDIFEHAKLYKEGKDKWEVWAGRAEYYRDHSEEFLLVTEAMTSGAYDIIPETKAFGLVMPDVSYRTIIRINTPLRKLRESIEADKNGSTYPVGRKYFERFSGFNLGDGHKAIETNWMLTLDEVKKARVFFDNSFAVMQPVQDALSQNEARVKVAVIVGMHKEKSRLSPVDEENPLGEDSVRKKISQLEELFGKPDTKNNNRTDTNIDWELIFVAHVNSPDNSGKVVEDILKKHHPEYYRSGVVRSVYMTGPGVGKGGKVIFGMKEALSKKAGHEPADIVLYTDADTTVDLRLTGLLLKPMILDEQGNLRLDESGRFNGEVAAYGSRVPAPGIKGYAMPGLDPSPTAEENIINGATKAVNTKYFFAPLTIKGYKETQCGFKAYPRAILEKILDSTKDTTFAFDTELMSRTLDAGGDIKEVGIFWSDSSAEASGTNALERWRMFKAWIEQYRNTQKVKTMDEEDLAVIEKAVDEAIALKQAKKDTIDIAEKIVAFAATLADKYFAYPAELNITVSADDDINPTSLEKYIKHAMDDAGVDKGKIKGYVLKDRLGRSLAAFDPASGKIEIDLNLALITPEENAPEAEAFQALINDIFRIGGINSTNIVKAHAIEENIKKIAIIPGEIGRLADANKHVIFDTEYTDKLSWLKEKSSRDEINLLQVEESNSVNDKEGKISNLGEKAVEITDSKESIVLLPAGDSKGLNGIDSQAPGCVVSSRTEENPVKEEVADRKEEASFTHPLVISLHLSDWESDTHCGSLLATPLAYQLAQAKAKEKYGVDLDALFRSGKVRIAVFHDAGSAKRCSPISQSQNGTRGDIRILGDLKTPDGKTVPLTLLLEVALQNSIYANADKAIDVHYVSQLYYNQDMTPEDYARIADPNQPYNGYDVLIVTSSDPEVAKLHEESFEAVFGNRILAHQPATVTLPNLITKFVVSNDPSTAKPEDLRDLGMYLADENGNVRVSSPKGSYKTSQEMAADLEAKSKEFNNAPLHAAYSCGSHRLSLEFIDLLLGRYQAVLDNRSKVVTARLEAPDFIQPILIILKAVADLEAQGIDTLKITSPVAFLSAIPSEARVRLEKFTDKIGDSVYNRYLDIISFYLENRSIVTSWVGMYSIGSNILWIRHRRPAEHYSEKMQLIADLTGTYISVDAAGNVVRAAATSEREKQASYMRGVRGITHPVTDSTLGNVYVNAQGVREDTNEEITFDNVIRGLSVGGVKIKNSIISCSVLEAGSNITNSVIDHVQAGVVSAESSYLEDSFLTETESSDSIIYNVVAKDKITATASCIVDVFRKDIVDSRFSNGQTRMLVPYSVDAKKADSTPLEEYGNIYSFEGLRILKNDPKENEVIKEEATRGVEEGRGAAGDLQSLGCVVSSRIEEKVVQEETAENKESQISIVMERKEEHLAGLGDQAVTSNVSSGVVALVTDEISVIPQESARHPVMILPVMLEDWDDDHHVGSFLATVYAYRLACEVAREKYGVDLETLWKESRIRICVMHDAGSASRCSPMSICDNSRGNLELVGKVSTPQGEVPITLMLAVGMQNSKYAQSNDGSTIDMHYTSQLYFNRDAEGNLTADYNELVDPSKPYTGYDVIILSSSYAEHLKAQEEAFEKVFGWRRVSWDKVTTPKIPTVLTKFTAVAKKADVTEKNLKDLGMYIAQGNIALQSMPKGTVSVDKAKELMAKGLSLAFSCGSHRTNREFLFALEAYYGEIINYTRHTPEFAKNKVQREAPNLIQPFLLLLEGLKAINNPQGQGLNSFDEIKAALEEDAKAIADKLFALKGSNYVLPAIKEVIDLYLSFRGKVADENGWIGVYDIGSPIYWWRHRRPAELYQEKMQMIADLTETWFEVDEKGNLTEVPAAEDRMAEARAMREFRFIGNTPVANSSLGGVVVDANGKYTDPVSGEAVTITIDMVRSGLVVGGVYIKGSVVQYSKVGAGSSIVNSVVNDTIANYLDIVTTYIDSTFIAGLFANKSYLYNVVEPKELRIRYTSVADIFRPEINDSLYPQGQTRVWAGFDIDGKTAGPVILSNNSYSFNTLRGMKNFRQTNTDIRNSIIEQSFDSPSRPLPNTPLPSREEVNKEVLRHNLSGFDTITFESEEVTKALEYLNSINETSMAQYLEYLAKAGLIRAGPLSGFLATAYTQNNTEYLLLSNLYSEYNTTLQRSASLVHEIGATLRFNRTHRKNQERGAKFLECIDIFNEEGEFLGLKQKTAAQRDGNWHKIVQIIAITPKGNIVTQKRGRGVSSTGMFDVTVGGHLEPGEKYLRAATREIKEETGLDISSERLSLVGSEGGYRMVGSQHVEKEGIEEGVYYYETSSGREIRRFCSLYVVFIMDEELALANKYIEANKNSQSARLVEQEADYLREVSLSECIRECRDNPGENTSGLRYYMGISEVTRTLAEGSGAISEENGVYTLRDLSAGSSINVEPDNGNTVSSMDINIAGKEYPIFFKGGMSVMWPFANRIELKDGLEGLWDSPLVSRDNESLRTVRHGMVRKQQWKVRDYSVDASGVYISSYLDTDDYPDIAKYFAASRITVTYHLKGGRLTISVEVINKDRRDLEMSLGFHPWFRVVKQADAAVWLPANKRWVTDNNLLPTGELLEVGREYNFRKGRQIGTNSYDDVFTDLEKDEDGNISAKLLDPLSGVAVKITASAGFDHFVLYAPEGKDVVCVEPQTSSTNTFVLSSKGIEEATPVILRPNQTYAGIVIIEAGKSSDQFEYKPEEERAPPVPGPLTLQEPAASIKTENAGFSIGENDPAHSINHTEKLQGSIVAEKLRTPLSKDVTFEMAERFTKGGYGQDGYGVSSGAVDGSFATKGDQGYYTEDSQGTETGKKVFLGTEGDMERFFARRLERLGKQIKLIIKLGIGGQHTPFEGIVVVITLIDPETGAILGEYELGKNFESALSRILKARNISWDQIAVIPSSKSGSTDETMMLFVEIFSIILKHIASEHGIKRSRKFVKIISDTLHEVNFINGKEKKGSELFKVEAERFGTDSLMELFARRVSPLGVERKQLREILGIVLGNMFFETTDNPKQSRLSAFIRNSGLDKELGEDAPGFGAMFENVGGRWTGDLHMMTFLAYYGLDAEAYWRIRREGIDLVRRGKHTGNTLGHKILDEEITDIALVVPDAFFWFGKSCEQNFNESIWQDGFANLVTVKQKYWAAQKSNYENDPHALVINLSNLAIEGAFNVFKLDIPDLSTLDKQGVADLFAELFTTFYGMTNTVGTRLIARVILKAGYTAEDVDMSDLDNPATKIVQQNLFLRQPYVELGKGLLEKRLKALQEDLLKNSSAIKEAIEEIKAKAREGVLEASIPGFETFKNVRSLDDLVNVVSEVYSFTRTSHRKLVMFVYLAGGRFVSLRDYLISLGIPWVMQGTGDQHISYQQVLAQPAKYLPFIISFVPEEFLPGRPAIGFAKGYLHNISPNMVRDYFAEASYRALTELRQEQGGMGLFLRVMENKENIEMLKSALVSVTSGKEKVGAVVCAKVSQIRNPDVPEAPAELPEVVTVPEPLTDKMPVLEPQMVVPEPEPVASASAHVRTEEEMLGADFMAFREKMTREHGVVPETDTATDPWVVDFEKFGAASGEEVILDMDLKAMEVAIAERNAVAGNSASSAGKENVPAASGGHRLGVTFMDIVGIISTAALAWFFWGAVTVVPAVLILGILRPFYVFQVWAHEFGHIIAGWIVSGSARESFGGGNMRANMTLKEWVKMLVFPFSLKELDPHVFIPSAAKNRFVRLAGLFTTLTLGAGVAVTALHLFGLLAMPFLGPWASAALAIVFAQREDIFGSGRTNRGWFSCGINGIIARADSGTPIAPKLKSLLRWQEKMLQALEDRGGQQMGLFTSVKTRRDSVKAVGVKTLKNKRGIRWADGSLIFYPNMIKSTVKNLMKKIPSDAETLETLGRPAVVGVDGHVRFATGGEIVQAAAHPHTSGVERKMIDAFDANGFLRRTGTSVDVEVIQQSRGGHNGDNDAMTREGPLLAKPFGIAMDLGAMRRFFPAVVHMYYGGSVTRKYLKKTIGALLPSGHPAVNYNAVLKELKKRKYVESRHVSRRFTGVDEAFRERFGNYKDNFFALLESALYGLPVGDSPVIPLQIHFYLTQGNWDAAIRYAHVMINHRSDKEALEDILFEDEEAFLGDFFRSIFDQDIRFLKRNGFKPADRVKSLADLWVSDVEANRNPAAGMQYKILQLFLSDLELGMKVEARRDTPAGRIFRAWEERWGDDADVWRRRFVAVAAEQFFTSDRPHAVREFAARSEGTYGIYIRTSVWDDGVTVYSNQQDVAVGINEKTETIAWASDPRVLKTVGPDGQRLERVIHLNDGEVMDLGFKLGGGVKIEAWGPAAASEKGWRAVPSSEMKRRFYPTADTIDGRANPYYA
ncbi:MAG: NUDIX domain-containing protein, partial [Candidatus Omnitrophota bacterium]